MLLLLSGALTQRVLVRRLHACGILPASFRDSHYSVWLQRLVLSQVQVWKLSIHLATRACRVLALPSEQTGKGFVRFAEPIPELQGCRVAFPGIRSQQLTYTLYWKGAHNSSRWGPCVTSPWTGQTCCPFPLGREPAETTR